MAQRSQAAKDDLFWSAVLERNTAYDGVVFYAVRRVLPALVPVPQATPQWG